MSTILTSNVTEGASLARISALPEAVALIQSGEPLPTPPSRVLGPKGIAELRQRLTTLRETIVARLVRRAATVKDPVERLIKILKDSATYRSRTRFDDPASMAVTRQAIASAIDEGRTLRLVLPIGGGKAPNPLKTGDSFLPDLSEWLKAELLAAIPEAIAHFHNPGATIHLIADAPLHGPDVGFPYPEVAAHIASLNKDLQWLGLDHLVFAPNTANFLPLNWTEEVSLRTRNARVQMLTDPEFAAKATDQVRSLSSTMNMNTYGWSYEHSVQVMAVLADVAGDFSAQVLSHASALWEHTIATVPHYIGVNHALRTLDIPRIVLSKLTGEEDYLRLTVHAKPGEVRPILTPSNSRARPGLIPMHGVGLRFGTESKPREAIIFDIEARMAGFTQVLDSDGRFLYYEDREPTKEL